MMDSDGILRHHLLYFDRPNGTRVPSMTLAQRYQDGLELPPVSARGFWYKAPGGFETRSITDVLEREDPAAYFAGKIVHIGLCAAGLQDSYVMAIDHARQMYGVEYQANAVQAMLEGSYKREIGTAPQLAGHTGDYRHVGELGARAGSGDFEPVPDTDHKVCYGRSRHIG